MSGREPKILVVDDELLNREMLALDLEEAGMEVILAEDGVAALSQLKQVPDIDVLVLDCMMPRMDGLELTKKLKSDPRYRDIPIIMQTAAGRSEQIREGVEAGVFYYLVKPYDDLLLLSVVKKALHESRAVREAKKPPPETTMHGLVDQASFRFRTLQDVRSLAYHVSHCCPKPDAVVYALTELMINAVEHGNLRITYLEKLELVMEDCWQEEVERRLALPENGNKYAQLTFAAEPAHITITIKDQGEGFRWQPYLDFDPTRIAADPHGRGIAIARATSFPNLEYRSGGSEVVCRVPLA